MYWEHRLFLANGTVGCVCDKGCCDDKTMIAFHRIAALYATIMLHSDLCKMTI